MTVAVILAGGSGQRMGGNTPKQFLTVAGKHVIEYSLDAFEQNALIDEICVVCSKDYVSAMDAIAKDGQYKKRVRVLVGGSERYLSSLAAIGAYSSGDEVDWASTRIVFHDAARPMVSQRVITQTVAALEKYRAVTAAVKTTDTIISVDGGTVRDMLDRSCLRNVQTPQAFRLDVIKKAYSIALSDKDFHATDDCGVVRRYLSSEQIFVVDGEPSNIKITYPQDILLCEALLRLQKTSPGAPTSALSGSPSAAALCTVAACRLLSSETYRNNRGDTAAGSNV